MLKFPTEEPKWSSDQAAALRQFLNGPSGQIFLQRLMWLRPTLPALPVSYTTIDPVFRIAHAEQLAGYERAISEIVDLTHVTETPST